jgi:signal transduction histidine kinase
VSGVIQRRRLARPGQASQLTAELPARPLRAAIDEHGLQRIVVNLVENAFVHGAPPVQVVVTEQDGYVVVRVADAGPGMPEDLLARATARFTRAPDARARPGSGLGLALVEQLVAEAGGELRLCHGGHHATWGTSAPVDCEHGAGMTATVLLPVASRPE